MKLFYRPEDRFLNPDLENDQKIMMEEAGAGWENYIDWFFNAKGDIFVSTHEESYCLPKDKFLAAIE